MESYGMNILCSGESPVTADIIFVHGLRGHPLKSWTKGDTTWPRDLLKAKIPSARIMTWGYDAQVANFFEKASQSSMFNHAQQLLQDISMERTAADERKRPIFFVAHSLGGLVVKDALCISYAESREEPVLNQRTAAIKSLTQGVVFLGTPHRGSNKAKWATVATNLMSVVFKDHNSKVIDSLVRGSETLERIQTNFSKFLITLPVWTFFEDLEYEKIGKIVDDDSATLGFPHEQKGWVPANHENMIKFSNAQDIGYKRVSYAISTMVADGLAARQAELSRGGINRSRQKCKRYISMKEHFFSEPKMLSFGCDEFIDNVLTCPGRWWRGEHRGKRGLFLKDSVEEAPEIDSAQQEEYTTSWKKPAAGLSRQNTLTDSWKRKSNVEQPVMDEQPTKTQYTTPTETNTSASRPFASNDGAKKLGSGTEAHEALLVSVEEGHDEAVLRLIRKGVDVNAAGGLHGQALATAAFHGRKEIVKILLENGALIDLPAGRDGYALHAAAAQGHVDVVKILLGRGANVQIQGGQFRFALTAAAFNGNMRTVKILLNEGAELNATDTENENALHGAVWGGHIEVVEYLLEQGIRADVKGTENGTPLEMAKQMGQQSIINLLSDDTQSPEPPIQQTQASASSTALKLDTTPEAEIDPVSDQIISQYLLMMLVLSAGAGNLEDVQTLLEAGVDPNESYGVHGFALHAACAHGHVEVVQFLLEQGAKIDAFGGQMGYCFHAACLSGSLLLVILLLAWGGDINAGTTDLGYPLHVASAAGHLAIMELLLNLGAPINAYGGQFGTALIAAATAGLLPSQYLVSRGANVLLKSPANLSVVDVARSCGHDDAKLFFKSCGAKSSGLFSVAGLVSRLNSFSLKVEKANLERESEDFMKRNATVPATAT